MERSGTGTPYFFRAVTRTRKTVVQIPIRVRMRPAGLRQILWKLPLPAGTDLRLGTSGIWSEKTDTPIFITTYLNQHGSSDFIG